MPDLTGKAALVTGAASGLGAACARELVSCGARVLLGDVNLDGASEVATANLRRFALSQPRAVSQLVLLR